VVRHEGTATRAVNILKRKLRMSAASIAESPDLFEQGTMAINKAATIIITMTIIHVMLFLFSSALSKDEVLSLHNCPCIELHYGRPI
jgi:hypothetical protein